MAARKNPKVQLPKTWTTAQVRVNPQGKVQIKIAPNKVRNPRNGYVVYPGGHGHSTLGAANRDAKRESKEGSSYYARVENVDTQKTVATWRNGKRQR